MNIHYFQRYHQKENVATANTMLLFSRLYSFSTDKFFRFLKSEYFSDSFNPELSFVIQEKDENSVPDATITQESFKIVIETKLNGGSFGIDQLKRHLDSFKGEKYKVLISLAPTKMNRETQDTFEGKLKEFNDTNYKTSPIRHINTTFEDIVNGISDILDDRDYEMLNVLEDYCNYCYSSQLISNANSILRMQLAGTTLDFNRTNNLYYDNADRGFRPHKYLGLYTNKSVRVVGKIIAQITAYEEDGVMKYNAEIGDITEERKQAIDNAIKDGYNYGYNLKSEEHRYFFVDKFYDTDFKKVSSRAARGTRIFDLKSILDKEILPDTEEIAELLKSKTWT